MLHMSFILRTLVLITAVFGAIASRDKTDDHPSILLRKSQESPLSVSTATGKDTLYATLLDSNSPIRRLLDSDSGSDSDSDDDSDDDDSDDDDSASIDVTDSSDDDDSDDTDSD